MTLRDLARDVAVPVLLAIALVLLIVNLAVRGLTPSFLGAHKDEFSALADAVTTLAVVCGAVLAYLRFFRGRTFSPRANIRLGANVIGDSQHDLLHSLIVTIENVGPIAIVRPRIAAICTYRYADGSTETLADIVIEEPQTRSRTVETVHQGESSSYILQRLVPRDVWTVTYDVTAELPSGRSWRQYLVMENTTDYGRSALAPD